MAWLIAAVTSVAAVAAEPAFDEVLARVESLIPVGGDSLERAYEDLLTLAETERISDRSGARVEAVRTHLRAIAEHAEHRHAPMATALVIALTSPRSPWPPLPLVTAWAAPLASADAQVRIEGFRDLTHGSRPQRVVLRALLERCNQPPDQMLRLNQGVVRVGQRLAWSWTWGFRAPGTWTKPTLAVPVVSSRPIDGPIAVQLPVEGMFGSRSGGGKKRAIGKFTGHALAQWRLRLADDTDSDGSGVRIFDRPSEVFVRWAQVAEPEPQPILDEEAGDGTWTLHPAPLAKTGGFSALVLPPVEQQGKVVDGLLLEASAAEGAAPGRGLRLALRVQDGGEHRVPWVGERSQDLFWWFLTTSDGLPVRALAQPHRSVQVQVDAHGISGAVAVPPDGLVAELAFDDLKPGSYQLLACFGPVSVSNRDQAETVQGLGKPAVWWEGTLVAQPLTVVIPAPPPVNP